MDISKIAETLYLAETNKISIPPLTQTYPEITAQDAYQIQIALMERKMRTEGSRRVGMKIGLTGKAMQRLIGVSEPDFGILTDQMLLPDGGPCPIGELIQPKVEGELAFCLKKELRGPNVTLADVYDAVDYVVPSIEIVDSRIENWKIGLQDTIADNGSSCRFVLGSKKTPIEEIDMRLVGMLLEKNGEALSSGTGAEVCGNPAAAVAWLANMLASFSAGMCLKAGETILSGAVTAADAAKAGDTYTVSFDRMGSVSVRFAWNPEKEVVSMEKADGFISTSEIEEYILNVLDESAAKGIAAVEIVSGDIHKVLGLKNRMPMVCNAMRKIKKYPMEIIDLPPSGYSSTLRVKYSLKSGKR